jgi:peroxiredoxin
LRLHIKFTIHLFMRHISLILLTIALLTGCAKKNQFTVEGKIEDGAGQKIFLYRMDLNNDAILDSAKINKDGSYSFKQPKLNSPQFIKLSLSSTNFITLLADSTEAIVVNGNYSSFARNYTVENSVGSKQIQLLNRQATGLRTAVDSLIGYYNNLPDNEKLKQLSDVSTQLTTLVDNYKTKTGAFIMDNHRSFASYYALYLTFSDATPILNVMDRHDQVYFATIATSLNLLYPESPRVRQLYNFVLQAKAEENKARVMDLLQTLPDSGIPDLTEKDVKGNEIKLSSLRGKVVLLSFTASWDEAARRENRALIPIYNRYKNKGFEIYQVSLERSRVLWENSVLQENIPWISVSDLQHTESYAARVYNVQRIPANYLVSTDGQIIGKDLFGSRLEEKLKEILR